MPDFLAWQDYVPLSKANHHFGALVFGALVIFWHHCKNIILALLFCHSHFGARDQLHNEEFAFVRICMQGVFKYYNLCKPVFKTVESKLD